MLRQRVITALLLAPFAVLVILWTPHAVTALVLALLVLAGAWEWAAFAGLTSRTARSLYAAAIAVVIATLWLIGEGQPRFDAVIYAALIWWAVALLWVAFAPTHANRTAAIIGGFLVLVPAWLALVRIHEFAPQLVLFLVLVVVAADVGAYFGGRQFGRHKLAPRVSPGKTWEGVVGGLVAAAAMTACAAIWFRTHGAWFTISAASFVAVSMLIVGASIVGDLTESLFKRHVGLKDSGNLLPGHGGVLDRVDSVTAAAPVFLYGLERLGLLS